jgi:hypothetical protein
VRVPTHNLNGAVCVQVTLPARQLIFLGKNLAKKGSSGGLAIAVCIQYLVFIADASTAY